ncbi:MAG: hypothetical protein IPQ07_18080 [Myxococcales bacterium]|nr:hypothetical protein [Myxococcales bacterium]
MSGSLEEWIVSEPIDGAMCDRVRALLRGTLPAHVQATVTHAAPFVRVAVLVPDDEIEAIAIDLDDLELPVLADWSDWQEDIEPPRDGATYQLILELVQKAPETFESPDEGELSILSVYAKDGDNRQGWPAAFVLAARLAKLLGAMEPEQLQLAN